MAVATGRDSSAALDASDEPVSSRPARKRAGGGGAGHFWPPRFSAPAIAACAYAALAIVAYWPVEPLSRTKVVSCGCYDVVEQMWFLSWTPHAIAHLLNPFYSNALNAPYGVNLAANTTMPLLGILASPITFTLGPVAAYNVLIRLALCSSALSMCLVLRHYRLRGAVAFLGGLVYGFSPYMLTQGSLHLNLCFVPLLPLILVAIDDLVVRRRYSTRRAGLTLGALATAQYFISSELLADLGVIAAIVLVLLALRYPRQALSRVGRALGGLAWALVPFVLLAGYSLAFGVLGPEHYVKNWQTTNGNEQIKNDLLSPLVPTSGQLLAPQGWAMLGNTLVGGVAENGGYLGIPLVLCWLAAAIWAVLVRNGRALCFAFAALAAFVLSLGPVLQVHGRLTTIHLPFALAAHIPLLQIAVAARYSLFVSMGVVFCVAIAFDALWTSIEPTTAAAAHARRRAAAGEGGARRLQSSQAATRRNRAVTGGVARRPSRQRRPKAALPEAIAASAIVVVALLPLFPSHPIGSAPVDVPSYFTTAAVDDLIPGSNVLVYPYPYEQDDYSMLWQAEAGFRFDLLGGYVLTPLQLDPPGGGGQGGADSPQTLDPPIVEILFYSANAGPASNVKVVPADWATHQIEQFLVRYAVGTIVVDTAYDPAPIAAGMSLGNGVNTFDVDPGAVTRIFRAMFGPPVDDGPLRIWYHASTRPVRPGYR